MHYTKEMLKAYTDEYGNIHLHGTNVTSLPEGLMVRRYLNLSCTPIAALPEGLSVGDSLHLYDTKITSIPKGLKVGYSLDLRYTPITVLPKGLEVGGNLWLSNTRIQSLPEGLKVGGSLDLSHTAISTLPEGLKVGGTLDIYNTKITSLPAGLKVGEGLRHRHLTLSDDQRLYNGDYVPNEYLYVDDILTFIKREKKIGEYTYYIGVIPNRNVIYDGTYYAHCENLKSGIQDLTFKHAKDRGSDHYRSIARNSIVSKEDAITMYRVITGACQQGTNMFVDSLREVKESYTIQEIIDLTRGQYRSDVFEKFFE